ncbi:ubiquitin family protein [Kitasatospora sp. Ki12]
MTRPEVVSSPYLHILFHGFSMIERHVPPVFARKQWASAEQAVCLSFSDPIIRQTSESACGWFLLGEEEFLPQVLRLKDSLMEQWGLRGTVWHGLSSGGYAALKYCARAGGEDLVFAVSPHNDPTVLPQWEREAVPFLDLPDMAEPAVITEVLRDWNSAGSARLLYAVIPENDAYFALHHLRPIMESLGYDDSVRAVRLRDGRGHGFISDADYDSRLSEAVRHWEERRARKEAVGDVKVVLPKSLAPYAGNESTFTVASGRLSHVIGQIHERYPHLRKRLTDGSGALLPFVSAYLGEDSVRNPDTQIPPRSSLLIVTAVAGG